MAQADLSKGVRGLAPLEDATYHDSNLKRIYSISFHPCGKLVAAAGHGGMASIFGIGRSGSGGEGDDLLLSWKAHQVFLVYIMRVSWCSRKVGRQKYCTCMRDARRVSAYLHLVCVFLYVMNGMRSRAGMDRRHSVRVTTK